MTLTIPSWRSPRCKCGRLMEIYLDVYPRTLRVKCLYCGREQSASIEGEIYDLTVGVIADTAFLLE